MAAGLIGADKSALDTPALVVDLDVFEANVERMAATFRRHGVGWRPHVKGIKVPALAHKLLRAGAHGVTCAKLGEAEVMAAAGIGDILIANQVVGPQKCARLAHLQRQADVACAVDHPDHVAALDAAARAAGTRIRVLIEIDTGMGRAGLPPGDEGVALARTIADAPSLRFAGLMGWEAHTVRIEDPTAKAAAVAAAIAALVDTASRCRAAGLPVGIVSCGGTGTYAIAASQPGVTEIQAGGGVWGDLVYRRNYNVDHPCSLTILATVTSRPTPTRVIVDSGRKTMSGDARMPEPIGIEGTVKLSAEHATIELAAPDGTIRIGDRIEFLVGYSDTTVHLHDVLWGVRGGRIEAAWPVAARGRFD